METCKMALVFAVYVMAMLVSANYGVAVNVRNDATAIPPTPMESSAVSPSAPAALAVIAFLVAWFI
ncbi:hypothetical protein L6164_031831 [Bauhinia variegata]|uniref:Uncharacterized protein n=1 Tax=Bauhinia variegata TaxID=167791 RepID=A0ACB9KM48_BAUVA|nr:hypothetical protein L6164_031831 [Bauhinia variegata]